jgi:hypothetical protein
VNTFHHLSNFIFHKTPLKPTFSHGAHYKSGLCKVKQAMAKRRGKSHEKTRTWGEKSGTEQNAKPSQTNKAIKIKAIEKKLNVKH